MDSWSDVAKFHEKHIFLVATVEVTGRNSDVFMHGFTLGKIELLISRCLDDLDTQICLRCKVANIDYIDDPEAPEGRPGGAWRAWR